MVPCALLVSSAHHKQSTGGWSNNGEQLDRGWEKAASRPILALPRHDACTPGRSGVVSPRPRPHVCPHPVTGEPSSSWTASTSLHWAFQEEVASSDLGGRRPKGGNVCWLLGISVLRTRPVFPTDVPRSQHKVANHVAVCYSTDVCYQANKYC